MVEPHPLYTGGIVNPTGMERLVIHDDSGEDPNKMPIRFKLQKPSDENGQERDQTIDAANHMRYAATLKLPELKRREIPKMGKAIIVGGAPSVKAHLPQIRALAANPENYILSLNWAHTWLIQQGIIPNGCVFFEIDAEPDSTLQGAHPDVTYYICSHCHPKTFDELRNFKRVLWHTPPNSELEKQVGEEIFQGSHLLGGGVGTFTRTLTIALFLGYRNIELFGVDSSFPDNATSTHVDGYETPAKPEIDGFYVYAKCSRTNEVRRFKSMGYLTLQVEEFKEYCRINHAVYALRVHGDSLLRFVHEQTYPDQYT